MRHIREPLPAVEDRVEMPSNLEPAEFYRREAARLRTMAASHQFGDVRDGLLNVARHYDVLADQAGAISRHTFGQPLTRPSLDRIFEPRVATGGQLD